MKKPSMRESMPITTTIIDKLRAAFGKDMIDEQIRQGIRGEPVFWARENGHEVGTRVQTCTRAISWDARGISTEVVMLPGETEWKAVQP